MTSPQFVDKIQNTLMSKKRRQEKWFHNCILAIEKGDCTEVQTYLSLYPNLPKDIRWANKKTRRADLGLFQLCVPLDRALRAQNITDKHHKIVKILLESGSDPLRPATHYPEGYRIIDEAIKNAFSDEKLKNLTIATSPQRKVLHELLSWVADNHNIDEVLCAKDTWRKACTQSPQLCKEILDNAKNSKSLTFVCVENNGQLQEDTPQIIRRLKI